MRAALRDFYCVLKDAGMYAFANPLSSETLIALKREQMQTLANRGAPDHAGIRGETREQSRRRPTAFLHHSEAQGWKPELRKELADVREGMHRVLDALIDSQTLPLREKAVLELLRNTGASKRPRLVELLHEARAERDEAKRQLKAERSENKQRTQAARADLEQRYHKLLQEHMTCGITIAKLEAQVAEYLAFLERFRSALQREEHS